MDSSIELTPEEWEELIALKDAISYDPHTVDPQSMERFTELFVRSLEGKGDRPLIINKKIPMLVKI